MAVSRTGTALARAGRALLVLWFVVPLVPLVLWAFANRWPFPDAVPRQWGFDGVRSALGAGAIHAFAMSTALGLVVAAVATPLGALAARALVTGRVHLPGLVAALLFAPVALPPFAIALGLDVLILRAHIPSIAAVVVLLVVAALPYTTYVMRAAFGAYDQGYEEEARTLGASRPMVLRHVQLPLLAPALSGAAFLAFLVGWSDYIVTLLIGGGRLITVPLLVGSFASGTGNDSVVAILSLSALVPPLALLIVLARRRSMRLSI